MTYIVNFENHGPGDIAKVDFLTHLDADRFDLSTFTIDAIGVGHESTQPSGNGALATGALAVNGTTVKLRSTLTSNGDLAVDLAGVPNQFQPDCGNFLPANTDANRPAGQGYVQFSVQLKSSVKVGTTFTQQGDILFNQHAFGGEDTPTNVWETTVVPNKHPLAGRSVVLVTSRACRRVAS